MSRVYNRERYANFQQVYTVPALFSPDADTNLIFLSGNGVQFFERTHDIWYHATIPGHNMTSSNADEDVYMVYKPNEAASPMGCTEQFQFCSPSLSGNKCGPLASLLDADMQSAPLFGMSAAEFETASEPNGTMISRYYWLVMNLGFAATSTQSLISSLGPNSLTSSKYLSQGVMGSLPDDQWKLDVKYWWAIFLASLQAGVVETARGSTDPALDPYKILPFNSHVRAMCNNQVRRLLGVRVPFWVQKLTQNLLKPNE